MEAASKRYCIVTNIVSKLYKSIKHTFNKRDIHSHCYRMLEDHSRIHLILKCEVKIKIVAIL